MNGIISVVQKIGRDGEGVVVLINDEWHNAVIDFGCVSFRILWVKFKFSRVKVCMVIVYGPIEGKVEEKERFWNKVDRVIDKSR